MGKLIELDVAIRTAVEYIEEWDGKPSMYHRRKITEKFMTLPHVNDVEMRHGEWMLCSPLYEDGPIGYVCSQCKIGGWEKTNYCPHCGARMDGENGCDG